MLTLIREALRLKSEGIRSAFVTVVRTEGSVPQIPGAKMLVASSPGGLLTSGTVGGGELEHRAAREAAEVLASGSGAAYFEKDLAADLGMACGGRVGYLVEPLESADRLVICGGGHIGLSVYRIMKDMDFSITVVDEGDEKSIRERFPDAAIVPTFDERELAKRLVADERTYVVIASRNHPSDFRLARFFMKGEWAYLGVIASARKAATLKKELEEEGYDGEKIRRLSSPIGIPLGGPRPEEIAVSIAAEIIRRRYGATR